MRKLTRIFSAALGAAMIFSFAACRPRPEGGGNKVSIFSRPTVERPAEGRKDWVDVDSFVCYYGSFRGDSEKRPVSGEIRPALEVLKEFDVAIVHSDPFFNEENPEEYKGFIRELKDAGTYVIAYISIGEDSGPWKVGDGLGENGYASYYIYNEKGEPTKNPSWPSYFVDAGNPVWQAQVLSKAKAIMDFGVDGLFLDTLDTVDVAYETLGGIVDLVRRLDEELPEGTKLVPNRGFTAFPHISQYVDGIMFESFSTTYDDDSGYFVDRDLTDLEYNQTVACDIVNRVRRYDYMPVFCLDYVNEAAYGYMPQKFYDDAWRYDFIPYVTYTRDLDVCPNPKIKPASKRGDLALSKLSESSGETVSNGDTSKNNLAYAGNGLCTVTVDSVHPRYVGARPLNDGFFATKDNHDQANWASECWASANNENDHEIVFTFNEAQNISKVKMYWAADGEGSPLFYSPKEARVEAFIGGEWKTVATYSWITAGGDYLVQQNMTEFTFDTVNTAKLRIVQPKNAGDATSSLNDGEVTKFSGVMWVSEVEIYA